jgi:hypothetical protein
MGDMKFMKSGKESVANMESYFKCILSSLYNDRRTLEISIKIISEKIVKADCGSSDMDTLISEMITEKSTLDFLSGEILAYENTVRFITGSKEYREFHKGDAR